MILLIDNYDSFSWNLAHLFGALDADVVVRRNDEIDADEAERLAPSHLVISPGPGRPAAAGATPAIVERLLPTTPTLGVCLGHQALVEVCGGEVGYARELVRWGIETTLVVPGAFTKGTNHFAHAGSPDDKDRLEEYRTGPYRGFEEKILKELAATVPPDADVSKVADAIALGRAEFTGWAALAGWQDSRRPTPVRRHCSRAAFEVHYPS